MMLRRWLLCRRGRHASWTEELYGPFDGVWEWRMRCYRCGHEWTEPVDGAQRG